MFFIKQSMEPMSNFEPENENKIIQMPSKAEREKLRKEKGSNAISEPMINMPPFTKYLLGILIGLYFLTGVLLPTSMSDWVYFNFGFIPEKIKDGPADVFAILSPITHMLLHGSWIHVIMNAFMLAAFGSGVERWLGAKQTLKVFVFSGLAGVLFHFILNTGSPYPMIGASGGISGLFAAAIVMMNHGGQEMGGRFGILPFALLWIGLSIGFGMIGGPDGSMIAWAAHVGGFLGGFAVLKLMKI